MTTSPLMDRAHRAAQPAPSTQPATTIDEFTTAAEPLPDIEYTDDIIDVPQVPVHVAFARVMADVQSITKGDKRDDVGGRYQFRGVDRVVNAVGPALRRHGVLCLPVRVYDIEYRETKTKSGTVMQECTLKVKWMVIGPMGDHLPELLESAGQATDTADKGTAKAESVAQRVLFLTGLHIPTQDPDIDKGHDRGERPRPKAADYRDEAVDHRTSVDRLRQMWKEAGSHWLNETLVKNENDDEEKLGGLIQRLAEERKAAAEW